MTWGKIILYGKWGEPNSDKNKINQIKMTKFSNHITHSVTATGDFSDKTKNGKSPKIFKYSNKYINIQTNTIANTQILKYQEILKYSNTNIKIRGKDSSID